MHRDPVLLVIRIRQMLLQGSGFFFLRKHMQCFVEELFRVHAIRHRGVEIDLRGLDSEEMSDRLEKYLDDAALAGLPYVRIIHGKGTGVLRKTVQEELKRNKHVKKYRLGVYGEGEDGVTIAELS